MFKSALYPAAVTFTSVKEGDTVCFMVKNGDDVRQDQLVLQIIKVMDSCLKKVGLDLKLTVYGVLATGPKSGLLDFIMTKVPSITLITLMARVFSFPSLGLC